MKAWKTLSRVGGVIFAVGLVLISLGCYSRSREMFVNQFSNLAKDIADWLLLPIAVLVCFCRLILAIVIHPKIYFNGLA